MLERVKALPGRSLGLILRLLAKRIKGIPLPRWINILLLIIILHVVSLPFPYSAYGNFIALKSLLSLPGTDSFTHLYTQPIYKWFHRFSIINRTENIFLKFSVFTLNS